MDLNSEKLEKGVSYLKQIEQEEEVIIFHHWDMDGVSSAAIISKILRNLRGNPADEVKIPEMRDRNLTSKDRKKIRANDKAIILDFVPPEMIEPEKQDFLIIDHHSVHNSYANEDDNLTYLNPRIWDDSSYIPCAEISNLIGKELDLNYDWISGLGVLQDFAVESHKELFYRLRDKYNGLLPEKDKLNQQTAKDSKYGRYSTILNVKPYKQTKKFSKIVYRLLLNSESIEKIEKSKRFSQIKQVYQEMCQEYKKIISNFETEKETYPEKGITFFEFKSDFYLNSSIATQLSIDQIDKVFLVIRIEKCDNKSYANISARAQSGRVNLTEILKDSIPESGTAGGHKKAAGARLELDKLEKFKENLIKKV